MGMFVNMKPKKIAGNEVENPSVLGTTSDSMCQNVPPFQTEEGNQCPLSPIVSHSMHIHVYKKQCIYIYIYTYMHIQRFAYMYTYMYSM